MRISRGSPAVFSSPPSPPVYWGRGSRSEPTRSSRSVEIAAVLVACLAIAGCQPSAVKPPATKSVEVIVARAKEKKDFKDYEDFTGTLEAYKKVEITSRVTGYLEKVNFKEGGLVTKGQVLFEIDPRPAKADLDKADATLVQAEARHRRLQGDYQRAQSLVASRAISREDFEKIVGDYEEAKAAVGVAAAGRKSAQLSFDYTKVHSPIAGRAGRMLLDEGNLIKADDTVLTMVVTQDPMHAYFDVDERTLLKLRRLTSEGLLPSSQVTVAMALADDEGFPHAGVIDFEDNYVDAATGTQRKRGVFANKNGLFAHGMFVRIHFQVGASRTAIMVPEEGVGTDQGQKFVYVVDAKNEIEYRKIKTGPLEKGWRVVDEGVSDGERIVVSGLQRVRPMMRVEPREESLAPVKSAHEPPLNLPKDAK
jgi:multidrug efflux system membrane fusion protein